MSLPINITELLQGRAVEWERLEFKAGWNPLDVVQTVCAFANDINNWGGGYIVIGVAEKDGQAVLPPKGIPQRKLDSIQKELMNVCSQLRPAYYPMAEPVQIDGQWILVINVPGGEARPYKAPDSLGKKRNYFYYVRHFATTKQASESEIRDLLQMSAHIPYDDRVRQEAALTDLKLPLIQSHLATIGSALSADAANLPFGELGRRMNIVTGPDEFLRPKNIGLLLFNDNPTAFFPCAQIDLVQFADEVGDSFTERSFTGPVQQQLQDALLYIKNYVISERVTKIPGQAEAIRVYNYPYAAIEEALVNTVYHRSYEDDSPIEIRIFPTRIEMLSYPGPLPPLNKAKLQSGSFGPRKYRNRRIGDFLKELRLTEGRGTGIPKIQRALKLNGSAPAVFDTDDELSYFQVIIHVNSLWLQGSGDRSDRDSDGDSDGDSDRDNRVKRRRSLLKYCLRPKKRTEIMIHLELANSQANFIRHVRPLIEEGLLAFTVQDKLQSRYQQYKTTQKGVDYLEDK